MSHALEEGKYPVFYDPKPGRRWLIIRLVAAGLFILLATVAAWFGPRQFDPLWHADQNTAAEYPQSLAKERLPVFGEGPLARIDLVKRFLGRAYLVDPFTGAFIRPATEQETQQIGSGRRVLERFGQLPGKQLALTFDDGPDAAYTPQILDILRAENAKATFFAVGENALKNPELVKRTIREGHMVGSHTATHAKFGQHGSARDREELVGTERIIRDIAGYDTRIYRLPYGGEEQNPLGVLTAQQLGYQDVGFTLDSFDWEHKPGQPIPLPKLNGDGHVVIMHDGGGNRQETVSFVKRLIAQAKAQGYTFVTLASLLRKEYLPKSVVAQLDDHISRWALWAWLVGWHKLIGANKWFMFGNVIFVSFITVLYVILAFGRRHYQKRRLRPEAEAYPDPVSVVIPAYNEAESLPDSLAALATTDPRQVFEVVVVCNGSTDGTPEVAGSLALKYDWLTVLQTPLGKGEALNAGIEAAQYDIVVTQDGDTRVEPDTLTKLARHFIDPLVGGVTGYIKVALNRKFSLRTILSGVWLRFQRLEYIMGMGLFKGAEGVAVAPGALSAWRKHVLQEVGGVCGRTFAEDFDLTVRVRAAGYDVLMDPEARCTTQGPHTLRALWRQRKRWAKGTMQVLWKQRRIIGRPRYGVLGVYLMPNIVLSLILSLVFMPLWMVSVVLGIAAHSWSGFVVFTAFATAIIFISSLASIRLTNERKTHLLFVPFFWYIYAPLRALVTYAALIDCIKGRAEKWFSPERRSSAVLAQHA